MVHVPPQTRSDIYRQFVRHFRPGDCVYRGFVGDSNAPPPTYRGKREKYTVVSTKKRADGSIDAVLRNPSGGHVWTSSNACNGDDVYEFTDETFEKVLSRTEEAAKIKTLSDLAMEVASLRKTFDDYSEVWTDTVVRLARDVSKGERGFATQLSSQIQDDEEEEDDKEEEGGEEEAKGGEEEEDDKEEEGGEEEAKGGEEEAKGGEEEEDDKEAKGGEEEEDDKEAKGGEEGGGSDKEAKGGEEEAKGGEEEAKGGEEEKDDKEENSSLVSSPSSSMMSSPVSSPVSSPASSRLSSPASHIRSRGFWTVPSNASSEYSN